VPRDACREKRSSNHKGAVLKRETRRNAHHTHDESTKQKDPLDGAESIQQACKGSGLAVISHFPRRGLSALSQTTSDRKSVVRFAFRRAVASPRRPPASINFRAWPIRAAARVSACARFSRPDAAPLSSRRGVRSLIRLRFEPGQHTNHPPHGAFRRRVGVGHLRAGSEFEAAIRAGARASLSGGASCAQPVEFPDGDRVAVLDPLETAE